MDKSVVIRFVPPVDVKIPVTTATTRTRSWNVEKLLMHLQASLEPQVKADLGEDVELQVIAARQADIRLNNVKPKGGVTEWKEALGEAIGDVMGDLDPDDFLSP